MLVRSTMLVVSLALAGCGGSRAGEANAAAPVPVESASAGNATTAEAVSLDAPVASPTTMVPASTNDSVPADGDEAAALPADVVAFRAKRDECDHFRGEEPTDQARAAFLTEAMERTCTGTDAALIDLRKRYAGNAAIVSALADYEDEVE